MEALITQFLSSPRRNKRLISLTIDFFMLSFACWLAMALRLGSFDGLTQHWLVFVLAPICAIPVMIRMGLYRAVIRYVGYQVLWTTVQSVTFGVLIWALAVTLLDLFFPRSSILIYWMAAVVCVGGTRLVGRWCFRQFTPVGGSYKNRFASRALIYGAGASGQQMAQSFLASPEVSPIGFIDDDSSLHGSEILGLRVYALEELELLVRQYGVDTILLSTRKMSSLRKREVLQYSQNYPVALKTLPSLPDVASGRFTVSDIANIDVADLLGRDTIAPKKELLRACIQDKVVMVTGAGGSIGSELCRQIITQRPSRLLLFELSEVALYQIDFELNDLVRSKDYDVEIVNILGDVKDRYHIERVMKHYQVETLYHAAAYKHVPIVENNMVSGIRNNVFGTQATAEAAIRAGVSHFVLVSTDKAVRPTNVMGASKRLAEMVLQALSQRERELGNDSIRFSMVRFGNVLGSSGSVIPLFRKQIRQGGPVTVTHPEITRYFMTIPEAASLVIQAGAMGHSGDVFVLHMGEPVKIIDLAKDMIKLAGFSVKSAENLDGDIEIQFSGLRAGEKLYEELLIGDDVQGTEHAMIMRSSEEYLSWDMLSSFLVQLDEAMRMTDYNTLRTLLLRLVAGFEPNCSIQDFLHCESELAPTPDQASIKH